jgi:Ni,Fe-hydrogenase III large subunit/Ni,Fe-hydrogenase III component G
MMPHTSALQPPVVATSPSLQIPAFIEAFSTYLGYFLQQPCQFNPQQHEAVFHLEPAGIHEALSYLKIIPNQSCQYVSAFACDNRQNEVPAFEVRMLFYLKTHHLFITLVLTLDSEKPAYLAISSLFTAANWHERELHDLFGIEPVGIEAPPLVLHRDWARHSKHYPMRKDFTAIVPPKEVPHHFNFKPHDGSHQVAVGPIHAGIIEPGHLRFSVTGEHIHQFDAQLFYTHKGIEKMAEGKHYNAVLPLAEHVCGLCAVAHSIAFCQSIEAALGLTIPDAVITMRAILLELERLGSHFSDLSAICSAGGFGFASARAAYFREEVLQLNQQLVGHRFLRNVNNIGGLQRTITQEVLQHLTNQLTTLTTDFDQWVTLALQTESFIDRVEEAGFVSSHQAWQLGLVGVAARGSGIEDDFRADFPYGVHSKLPISVRTQANGDAFARFKVRLEEVTDSLHLIPTLIATLPATDIIHHSVEPNITTLPPHSTSFSMVESAKGGLLHWVQFGVNNTITRWHIRSASYMNWRGVVHATMGNNIVPDGPLVNKSFNLCYACCDR